MKNLISLVFFLLLFFNLKAQALLDNEFERLNCEEDKISYQIRLFESCDSLPKKLFKNDIKIFFIKENYPEPSWGYFVITKELNCREMNSTLLFWKSLFPFAKISALFLIN
jgi:hypothetical protein